MVDCHIHMIMDGKNLKNTLFAHKNGADESLVRQHLSVYEELQYTYLRDGGDRHGVCQLAARLAPEYGITYVQPAFPICKQGHYGGFLCRTFGDFSEYLERLQEVRQQKGDFVKLMLSGLMDFQTYGKVSESPLEDGEIRDMIAAAHDMGFPVMAHCNGAACSTAISAEVDSLEHGGYMDKETLHQLAESNTVWVPTLSPVANLIGKGLFPDETLQKIKEMQRDSLRLAHRLGADIALGSDAAAGFVPHGTGGLDEKRHLLQALGADSWTALQATSQKVQKKFKISTP